VTVVPVQNAPSIFGVDATVFYSVIGVVVVAVIGGVVVLMRRRSK
jgi:LPXTG-motif cell wall-anchored protein